MIKILDHENSEIAEKIYTLFQVSYAIEAKLLEAKVFPPLNRTVSDFIKSDTSFFGHWQDDKLVGAIELRPEDRSFHICSLVVDPDYFRQGIAGKLINFIFNLLEDNPITVETGLANRPAVALYESFGFKEVKQYVTDHGIRKVRFLRDRPN